MKLNSKHAALVAALSCLPGLSSAQDADQRAAYRAADRNHSGAVSLEEFRNYAVGAFHHVDADHDGTVTQAEYAGVDAPVAIRDFNAAMHAHFVQYDADQDGSLDLAEWVAVPSADPAKPTHIAN